MQGISHAASRFGAAIGPPIAVFIMIHYGWRSVFYVIAVLSLLWSSFYLLVYRNMPEEHAKVSGAELARIRGLDEKGEIRKANIAKRPKVPWSVLLKHGNMWAIMCAYAAYIYSLWFFLSWLPSYLVEYPQIHVDQDGPLRFHAPHGRRVVGDAFGGWLTDKLFVKTNNLKFSRRSVAITAMLGCGTFTMFAALSASPFTAVYCLTAALFFLEMTIGPAWAVPMDVGGRIFRHRLRHDEHGRPIRSARCPPQFSGTWYREDPGWLLSPSLQACYSSARPSGPSGSIPSSPSSTEAQGCQALPSGSFLRP